MPMDVYAAIGALVRAEMVSVHTPQPDPSDSPAAERTDGGLASVPVHATTEPVAVRWRPFAAARRRITAAFS
ncbi:hypothetical protein ACLQ2D_02015 [Streptomyces sp. DT199]|uniref:hypothetical protein n=1 Tax=Streptomyces sp. DT199 TaxID=3393421 RepID=UPI003CF1FD75